MVILRNIVIVLAVAIVGIPLALYAQSETAPLSASPAPNAPLNTAGGFTIASDVKSGGVWRLNSSSGELWYCVASLKPKCFLAQNGSK
jgi:hypothetical protein